MADLLAYETFGSSPSAGGGGTEPAIVLLHPSGFGPAVMEPFARELAASHHVIVPRRRGYIAGEEPMTSLEEHHDQLAVLLQELGLDRPVLVGVSAGATLALGFVQRHPGVAAGAIVHEPLLGPIGGRLHRAVTERIADLTSGTSESHHAALFISGLVGLPTWNSLREDWRTAVDRNQATVVAEATLFGRFALTDEDLRALPANVVSTVGERSDPMRGEVASVLVTHGVTTRVLPGATHLPMIESPNVLADTIDDVIAAVRATAGRAGPAQGATA